MCLLARVVEKPPIWYDRVYKSSLVHYGAPCIKGTRVPVYKILELLSRGLTLGEVIDDFPELKEPDICAALSCAAAAFKYDTDEKESPEDDVIDT